jgi:hypothetical protein
MSGNLWTNIKANHWNKNSDGISTSADMLILFEVGLLAPLGHFFQPREKNATQYAHHPVKLPCLQGKSCFYCNRPR